MALTSPQHGEGGYYSLVCREARDGLPESRTRLVASLPLDLSIRRKALREIESSVSSGQSAAAWAACAEHLKDDAGAHDVLELFLETCRIRDAALESGASALIEASRLGSVSGPDQRGLLDALLLLRDPGHVAKLADSDDLVVRLVGRLASSTEGDRGAVIAAVEREETPGNALRALLIEAAWRGDATAIHDLTSRADPSWIPMTTLRRALRVSLAERDTSASRALLDAYARVLPGDTWAEGMEARLADQRLDDVTVAAEGFPYSAAAVRHEDDRPSGSRRPTVLYAVHSSFPFHRSGYSVRTQALAAALQKDGVHIIPVTRLGYPADFGIDETPDEDSEVGEITYRRLRVRGEPIRRSPIVPYVRAYADALEDLARTSGAQLIHAATNHVNGFAANEAARRLGIPSIYEVRGLWEVTRASRDPVWGETAEYVRAAALEAHAAQDADHVITLTSALADEMVRRGVDAGKITVVPNGVDLDEFEPATAEMPGRQKRAPVTFGYIGSLVDYEGIDQLLRALADRHRSRRPMRARIVGDGPVAAPLHALAEQLGISHLVDFVGAVPHDQVIDEYRHIDVLVYPRLPLPVCQMVSPLKPFEAMALAKPVIVSNVHALREIAENTSGAVVVEAGNPRSLARSMRRLAASESARRRLGARGRLGVATSASWQLRAREIRKLYCDLLE